MGIWISGWIVGCGGENGGGEGEAEAEAESEGEADGGTDGGEPGCVSAGEGWSVETLPTTVSYYSGGRLAVDSEGVVHMSYLAESPLTIGHAYRSAAGEWQTEDVTLDNTFVSAIPIAVDSSGGLHVVWQGTLAFRYATREPGGTWSFDDIDSTGWGAGDGASMRVDQADGIHISYYVGEHSVIKHAYRPSGGAWSVQEIESAGGLGEHSSLVVDDAGRVHVAFVGQWGLEGVLRYGRKDPGGDWTVEDLWGTSELVDSPSIGVDDSGTPRVVYHRWESDILEYAVRGASDWTREAIDSSTSGSPIPAMAVDDAGEAHVVYFRTAPDDSRELLYVSSASGWTSETVDSVGNAGIATSLRLDRYGLHVGYSDLLTDEVKYAHKCP